MARIQNGSRNGGVRVSRCHDLIEHAEDLKNL